MGDICSSLLKANGEVVNIGKLDRLIVISPTQLRSTYMREEKRGRVVAVAGGITKLNAIKAVLAAEGGSYISDIVTDISVGRELIKS